jgi:hypothetical protein
MSITFGFVGDDDAVTIYSCAMCEGARGQAGCIDCRGTGIVTFTNGAHDVNMANGNAFHVAKILEIPEFDEFGEISAQSLRELCANMTWAVRAMGSPNFDYLSARVGQLHSLALAAIAKGVKTIGWG